MRTIAIDPGVDRCAWALALDGQVVGCGVGDVRDVPRGCDCVVVELPVVYGPGKSRTPPEDLVRLAFAAGRQAQAALRENGATLELVTPEQWKGQVPKAVVWERARRVLTESEAELVDRAERSLRRAAWVWDLRDAVALLMRSTGRTRRGGAPA